MGCWSSAIIYARAPANIAYRAAVGVAVVAALLLVRVNRAVGIVGATVVRFQPHGMARALVATALAQASVAVMALTA